MRIRKFRRRRIGVVLLGTALLLGVPLGWSYASALTAPGNDSVMARTAEWLRDEGAGVVVDWAERQWFGADQPPTGGEPEQAITAPDYQATAGAPRAAATSNRAHLQPPAALATPAAKSLPDEGVWHPAGPPVDDVPAMYATQIRPDAVHTSVLVAVAWLDPKLLTFRQFPGAQVPGGAWATPNRVPLEAQAGLLAAFNGGFRMQDAQCGFYQDGKANPDLRDGSASLVISRDGTPHIGEWGRDQQMSPDVVSVRQNLSLLVDGGRPAPDITNASSHKWGKTLGNEVFYWRSGIGTTADGALVWVGGPGLSVSTLADTLVRAGAVNAMELDINPDWVTFNIYHSGADGMQGKALLSGMKRPGNRYLSADSRDFVAVFVRPA